MIEKAIVGRKKYWVWIFFLFAVIFVGLYFYLDQLEKGLTITGLSRDVSWGLYIGQLTFLVGVAASAVMVVLPYYLHDYKAFGKLVIFGEFLAIASVIMCVTFVVVDIGQPSRMLNLVLYPSPNSLLFWDTVVLSGYLLLNIIISVVTFDSERKGIAPPGWIKPIIILSIPWAISIHTVTAFLYSGLASRSFWMTAVLAPRFLASAFAGGPAILLFVVLIIKKYTNFKPESKAIQALAKIITYAMCANVFLFLMEIFTVLYSDVPEHMHHFEYLFFGLNGKTTLVPFMWTSVVMAVISLILLLNPKTRNNESILFITCFIVFVSIWIEKGLSMVITGFIPSPFEKVTEYWPTLPEIFITIAIYAMGILIITLFYKMTLSARGQFIKKN
jgi:molybdopterin-containing oxidoreductase family membrane subunit